MKELRKEKGITQEQAAEHFGVAGRTISRWETGSNMPDLSLLIDIADFYGVEVGEIIDGERKSENMNDEMKETLEKVVDYNEVINMRAMKIGVISMACVFIILVIISGVKDMSSAPLVSMICAYNGAIFISRSKQTKDKMDMLPGALFIIAMIANTVAFIVK